MEVVEVTRRLVAIDSQNPGPGEAAIAASIEADCREHGFEVRRVEPVAGRPNLLITVDRGPGPHLGLSGHLDTKPVGDATAQWRSDPFTLTLDDGFAYGLGACDMKGAVAAMLVALRRFAQAGPAGKLTLILTADEEQGSAAGAQALAERAALHGIDGIVIGEPSGTDARWEALPLVSRGICCFEVDIRTVQGHSGLSERLGRNAVQLAADLVHALEEFRPPVAEPGPIPCAPTVNPGMLVSGGVCFGTWPGLCTVASEIRLVPGMDRAEVRTAIESLAADVVGDAGTATVRYAEGSLGWMPAAALDPDAAVVAAAQRAARRILGAALPIAAYPGGTDATYFLQRAGVPTVTSLGPGSLRVAHAPNEYVPIDELHDAVELYAALAEEFCAR